MVTERVLEYDDLIKLKEKRRVSMQKGKKSSPHDNFERKKTKKNRNIRKMQYSSDMDYDTYGYNYDLD
ncbi:hypothetical protein [Clostridium sp. DL1XJH146]